MTQSFWTSPVLASSDDLELQHRELWHMYQSSSCYFGWHRASTGFCFNCLAVIDMGSHFQYHKLSFLFLFFILVFCILKPFVHWKASVLKMCTLFCIVPLQTSVLFNRSCVERFFQLRKEVVDSFKVTSIPKFVLYKCCSCCVTTKYFADAVAVVYIVTKCFADPQRDVWWTPLVWNLGAVIWFLVPVSCFFCLVFLLFLSCHFSANGPLFWLFSKKTQIFFVKG